MYRENFLNEDYSVTIFVDLVDVYEDYTASYNIDSFKDTAVVIEFSDGYKVSIPSRFSIAQTEESEYDLISIRQLLRDESGKLLPLLSVNGRIASNEVHDYKIYNDDEVRTWRIPVIPKRVPADDNTASHRRARQYLVIDRGLIVDTNANNEV